MSDSTPQLALNGGTPVTREPFPTTWLGPAAIGEEEVEAVAAVVRSQRLFRFLDPASSQCTRLENHFREMTGCAHALAVGGGTASLIAAVWVSPTAQDADLVYANNRQATAEALANGMANRPSIEELLAVRDIPINGYYVPATLREDTR